MRLSFKEKVLLLDTKHRTPDNNPVPIYSRQTTADSLVDKGLMVRSTRGRVKYCLSNDGCAEISRLIDRATPKKHVSFLRYACEIFFEDVLCVAKTESKALIMGVNKSYTAVVDRKFVYKFIDTIKKTEALCDPGKEQYAIDYVLEHAAEEKEKLLRDVRKLDGLIYEYKSVPEGDNSDEQ